jgi:TPR repeat protein
MSSPIDRSSDRNTVSQYAPRWARDNRDNDDPQSLRSRLRLADQYFPETPANDSDSMSERGLHFKSLEPTLVPEPPMPEAWQRDAERYMDRNNSVAKMLLRFFVVVVLAALFSLAIAVLLPGTQRFAGLQKAAKQIIASTNDDTPSPAAPSAASVEEPTPAPDASPVPPTPARPQPASPERLAATQPTAKPSVAAASPAHATPPSAARATPAPAGQAKPAAAGQMSASSTSGKSAPASAPAKTSPAQLASIDATSKSSAVPVTSVKTVPIRPTEPVRPLGPDEIETLLKQGANFVSVGDFASARVVFGRVAEARDARGAVALAATYDPVALAKINAKGATPDIAKARQWYNKASELGSRDVGSRLAALEKVRGASVASGNATISAHENAIGTTGKQPGDTATSENSQASDASGATASYWKNDASIMRLDATGVSRKFIFFKPSGDQMKAGAKVGSLRFDGQISGDGYSGTAFSYSEKCGRERFPVSGQIENNGARVILSGKSPQMDGDCREIGKTAQTLVFDFVEPSAK